MDKNSKEEELLNCWAYEVPVDISRYLKKLDIYINSKSLEEGVYAFIEDNQIIINSNISLIKVRRYIIAHSIYYILHNYKNKEVNKQDCFWERGILENNLFAIKLLVPEKAVDYFLMKKNVTSIKELSEIFLVSEIAIKYRLKVLGYL